MAYGITAYGLDVPNLQEWIDEYHTLAKTTFGSDINLTENSLFNKFFGIFAYQDMKIWNVLQAAYSSQTVDGAEGIYLDEVFGRRGVFRKSASATTGYVSITSNSSAPWSTSIDNSYTFVDSNDKQYNPETSQLLSDRVVAYSLLKSAAQAAGTSLTFYIQNTTSGLVVSQAFTTNSSTFLADLQTFILSNLDTSDSTKVIIDSNTIYVGYTSGDLASPVGLSVPVKFYTSIAVGTKYSEIQVVCNETGSNEVLVGAIKSMSPTLSFGYVSVSNLEAFTTGSDVETDAEYRDRFNSVVDEAVAATRPAIYKALTDLDGVEKVMIYDNPTSSNTPEADAFSFNTVIIGGTTADIAQKIYDVKPINTLTDGTTTYTVDTEDGSTEVIKFTYGAQVPYNIKIEYITANSLPLSPAEQNLINTNIVNLAAEFKIGGKVFNAQLQSAIFSAVGFSRLTGLTVYTKKVSELDTAYTTANISSAFSELATLDSSDIFYSQTF